MTQFQIQPRFGGGFSFALHLMRVQGFYFCSVEWERLTSIYSGFFDVHAIIQPKRQNRLQGFTGAFPLICPIPAHAIQRIHKLPIHRHAGRCVGQHNRPIIIRYIGAQRCALLWIHARQCNASQTMPARRGLDTFHTWRLEPWHRIILAHVRHYVFSWHGGAEPLAACRRISFRAFAQ